MKLASSRVEANRNFANKIWQAARFVLGNLGDDAERAMRPPAARSTPDAWHGRRRPLDPQPLPSPGGRGDSA